MGHEIIVGPLCLAEHKESPELCAENGGSPKETAEESPLGEEKLRPEKTSPKESPAKIRNAQGEPTIPRRPKPPKPGFPNPGWKTRRGEVTQKGKNPGEERSRKKPGVHKRGKARTSRNAPGKKISKGGFFVKKAFKRPKKILVKRAQKAQRPEVESETNGVKSQRANQKEKR